MEKGWTQIPEIRENPWSILSQDLNNFSLTLKRPKQRQPICISFEHCKSFASDSLQLQLKMWALKADHNRQIQSTFLCEIYAGVYAILKNYDANKEQM